MPTIAEAITIAIGHHQAGRLQEAEEIYRQILAADSNCVDAWNLLGVMASQMGQHPIAIQCVSKALSLKPDVAELHYNLGVAFHGLRRLDEARASYSRALELDPQHVMALINLGNVWTDQGHVTHAIECFLRARQLKPDLAIVHYNLGNAYKSQSQWDEAIACYRQALALQPTWGEAVSNLGDALQGRGELDDAAACYRRALELLPDSAPVLSNLGSVIQKQGHLDEALALFRRAVQIQPDLAKGRLNLAAALHTQGNLDEAQIHAREAQRLDQNSPDTHNVLGLVLRDLGQLDEALQCCQRALALQPDHVEARTNHAMLLLASGDFHRGWPEYEWRWKSRDLPPRVFDRPQWDGRPLDGQTILLHAEQGLGDTLQFIRYAEIVKRLGPTVVVECQRSLAKALASCPGIDQLIRQGENLPPFDVHAPLLSLPTVLKTTPDTVPAAIPYLYADPALVAQWREKLSSLRGFKIGINWRGRPGKGVFRRRDIPLECFQSLAGLPIVLVSLQQGATEQELAGLSQHVPTFHPSSDVDQSHGPFMDTAAIMMNLDLVITSDTSVPHLAGALGVPVWIALPFVASWQWMRDREGSPWCPTARPSAACHRRLASRLQPNPLVTSIDNC